MVVGNFRTFPASLDSHFLFIVSIACTVSELATLSALITFAAQPIGCTNPFFQIANHFVRACQSKESDIIDISFCHCHGCLFSMESTQLKTGLG